MRKLQGTIVSNKMKHTVVVKVNRLKPHPRYHKSYRISKKYKAHDEMGEYRVGDAVTLEEVRPMSREKRWKVIGLVKQASTVQEGEADMKM